MNRKAKITIAVVSVLSAAAAAAIWYVYKNRKEVQAETAKIPTYCVGTSEYDALSRSIYPAAFPLKKGKTGNADLVKVLQAALNAIPPMLYAPIAVDGVFGKATEALLKNKLGVTEVSQDLFNRLIKA